MTAFPALFVGSTLQGSPQTIQRSIVGKRFGFGSSGQLINAPGAVGSTVGETPAYPLKPEAGAMITATTADVIGNYGKYKTSSSSTSPLFTIADPVPGCEVDLILFAPTATAIKFNTQSSNVTFSSSAQSFAVGQGSSLFYDAAALTLVGMSTGGYRIKAWTNNYGSTLSTLTFTTG